MQIVTKVLSSVFQVKAPKYLVLVFGILYGISSEVLAKQANLTIHDNNKFTELSVYQDRPMGMVMINTKDSPEIITAYADNHCDVHGQLSIVKTSITDPQGFSYLQPCISANSVDNVILKKDSNDNVYVAYIENGSNDQIHLKWLKNGEDKFTDFPHSEQLAGKNPLHIDLAIDNFSQPIIVYTAQDGYITYLYALKYENDVEDASKSGFIFYTPGQQGLDWHVTYDSHPRIAYNSLGDLYIAYIGDQIGLVKFDSDKKWNYISDIGNINISHDVDYPDYFSNAFDMVIKGNMLYLAGIDPQDPDSNFGNVAVFTYDTESDATFKSFKHFYTANKEWEVKNLKLYVNTVGNLYASVITKTPDKEHVFNSYFVGVFDNRDETNEYAHFENYKGYSSVDELASDVAVLYSTPSDSYGYYLYKYNNNSADTNNDVAFAYKMSFFAD